MLNRDWKLLIILFAGYLSTIKAAVTYDGFNACTDTSLSNQGLYFTLKNNIYYWNHCGFPNPRTSPGSCNRDSRFGAVYDFCNIESILSGSEAALIDQLLAKTGADTSFSCNTENNERMNITLQVVAVNHIRMTNMSNSASICYNDCGQFFPEFDLTSSDTATQQEVEFAVDVFAQRLAETWGKLLCNSTVVVVYWHDKQTIGTGVPDKLRNKLSEDKARAMRMEVQTRFNNNATVYDVLEYVLNEYHNELVDIAPAYWLMLIMFALLILVFIFMAWQYQGESGSNEFDESKIGNLVTLGLRIISGIFMFEVLLKTMLFLDSIIQPWHVVVFGGGVMAGFSVLIFMAL